mmetsp:Transcript_10114/g.29192  ORF Transcript_10114/g.29192 Transcript_10114/m.29192 type:complete len:216 (+) Transcript_10114:315-962(+)
MTPSTRTHWSSCVWCRWITSRSTTTSSTSLSSSHQPYHTAHRWVGAGNTETHASATAQIDSLDALCLSVCLSGVHAGHVDRADASSQVAPVRTRPVQSGRVDLPRQPQHRGRHQQATQRQRACCSGPREPGFVERHQQGHRTHGPVGERAGTFLGRRERPVTGAFIGCASRGGRNAAAEFLTRLTVAWLHVAVCLLRADIVMVSRVVNMSSIQQQ